MDHPVIPDQGLDHQVVLERLEALQANDTDYKRGRTWSLVYYAGEAHTELLSKAHTLFLSSNGLNPTAFGSLKRLEAEVVRMTATMLNGPDEACGTMTSGGTESILMAVKTYRARARAKKPWIRRPEMVLPRTIHSAFDKAAHYFGIRVRYAEVGPDKRADVRAIKRLINRNTILIAASAPQYPHGVVDPIEAIGALAAARKIPFHVDACFGGFILPWIEAAGYPVPTWDFRVPGVTSISADIHKYGYAAKGASTILYRNMSYLRHQFFISTDWPGGIYASPSMAGTRPGGPIAAAWAALMAVGKDGYISRAREAMQTAKTLREGIEAIPELSIVALADAPIVTYQSADPAIDIFVIADHLQQAGWEVSRQQHPNCIHCSVTANHRTVVPDYLAAVQTAVDHARAHPEAKSEGDAALYGMMAKVPVRALVKSSVRKVMEAMYAPGVYGMPDLGNLGQGDDDGLVLQLVARYGDQAIGLLDRAEHLRKRLRTLNPRR
jgi:glutamate/tyrosine decarboxylase-like PLP-dependent enzyme